MIVARRGRVFAIHYNEGSSLIKNFNAGFTINKELTYQKGLLGWIQRVHLDLNVRYIFIEKYSVVSIFKVIVIKSY